MKKVHLNAVMDALAGVAFVLLMSTGAILAAQLPARSGPAELLGLTRHQWGAIHFVVAMVLIGVLAVHVILHWNWIICVVRGKAREGSGGRFALGIVAVLALLAVIVVPQVSPVDSSSTPPGVRHGADPDRGRGSASTDQMEWVRGSTTLDEIERNAGIPYAGVLEELGLPTDLPGTTRLSDLHQQYRVPVGTVRFVIRSVKANDGAGSD